MRRSHCDTAARPFSEKRILCSWRQCNNVIMSSKVSSDIIMSIKWRYTIHVCVSHINTTQGWLSHIQYWSEVRLYADSTHRSSAIHNLRLVWDPGPSVALASMLAWKPHDPSTVYRGMLKTVGSGLTSVERHQQFNFALDNTLQHIAPSYSTMQHGEGERTWPATAGCRMAKTLNGAIVPGRAPEYLALLLATTWALLLDTTTQSWSLPVSLLEGSQRFVPTCALLPLRSGGSTLQNLE